MSARPVVSVIIPSHRPRYRVLAEASVDAQTFPDYEMIVRASPLWWPAKINDAMRAGVGEFLLMLGDDDLLHPTCLERMVAKAREGYDIVASACESFGEGQPSRVARFGDFSLAAFRAGNPVWITSLVRRELFVALGGFDEDQLWYDYEFWYRAFKHDASFGYLPTVEWRHREGHAGKGTSGVDADDARRRLILKHPELGT